MDRTIIYSKDFDDCVEGIGGYRAIDTVLETIVDGLRRNPFGFPRFENDALSFRYATTDRLGNIPPLYVIFTVNADRTVTLVHVEEIQSY